MVLYLAGPLLFFYLLQNILAFYIYFILYLDILQTNYDATWIIYINKLITMSNNFNITNISLKKFNSNNKSYNNLTYTIFIKNLNITLDITKQYINNKIKNYLIDDHTLLTSNLSNQLITYINSQY